MKHRTPPAGYPITRASSQWDDITQPGQSDYEMTEMRRRRAEKISKAYELAVSGKHETEELRRRVANIEIAHEATRRDIGQIKEGQAGLAHVADQIFDAVRSRNEQDREAKKLEATEGGAWRRQFVQTVVALAMVALAIVTLAMNKC